MTILVGILLWVQVGPIFPFCRPTDFSFPVLREQSGSGPMLFPEMGEYCPRSGGRGGAQFMRLFLEEKGRRRDQRKP